jgi:hypothetical protein
MRNEDFRNLVCGKRHEECLDILVDTVLTESNIYDFIFGDNGQFSYFLEHPNALDKKVIESLTEYRDIIRDYQIHVSIDLNDDINECLMKLSNMVKDENL